MSDIQDKRRTPMYANAQLQCLVEVRLESATNLATRIGKYPKVDSCAGGGMGAVSYRFEWNYTVVFDMESTRKEEINSSECHCS